MMGSYHRHMAETARVAVLKRDQSEDRKTPPAIVAVETTEGLRYGVLMRDGSAPKVTFGTAEAAQRYAEHMVIWATCPA